MRRSAAALLIATSLVAHTPAQTPKGSARIRGRVVAAATGKPLLRATVWLGAVDPPHARRSVMTDSNGHYEIPGLPAGRYSFSASHVGYLEQQFDQPLPLSRYRLLELAAGEQLDGIDFSLHRGGAVVGIIIDEFGDPLPGVRVEAMREVYGVNGRSFIPELRMSEPPITDDEGRYRVYGLPPGAYIVAGIAEAPATDSESSGYAKTYYPGTMNEPEAQIIRVGLGEDASADFAMAPARLSRVSGIVRDSQGRSASGIRLTLTTSRGAYFETIAQTGAENDGSFRFDHVRPGEHVIYVRRGGEPRLLPRSGEWAAERVSVTGEDVSDLIITTSSGFIASGRVIYEGSSGPTSIKGLRILTNAVERSFQQMSYISTPENGLVDDTGRFRIHGVTGRVRLSFTGSPLPAGWFLKRALSKGTDITDSGIDVTADIDGLEVVLTDRATTVSGTVRNAQGVSLNNCIITFFPVGQFSDVEKGRRLRTIRPDPDGTYRIRNVPPGEYLAAAVPVMSLPIGGEWEPAFFERVRPLATGFRLTEGQTFVLNLSLIE